MPTTWPSHSKIDFAELNLLQVVQRCGSFTAAAEELKVNQSAVSYTIAKLRNCFHDPLFVREAGKQVATDRCEDILRKSAHMLEVMEEMLQPHTFEPRQSTREITIACNYYERVLVIPRIVAAIRREAPGMTVKMINSLGDGQMKLLNREADILIGPFDRSESGFHSRKLFSDHYVCLVDPIHPEVGKLDDPDVYLGLNHVLINFGVLWKSPYLREIESAGHALSPMIVTPSPAGLGALVQGSDLVATIPRRLGERISGSLVLADCAFPGKFDISMIWASHTHASAMHRWLRGIIWAQCHK